MIRVLLPLWLCVLLLDTASAAGVDVLKRILRDQGPAIVQQAKNRYQESSVRAYRAYVDAVGEELTRRGEAGLANRIESALERKVDPTSVRSELAWLTHTFAREFYVEEIVRKTGELMQFKTFASDVPNRLNPEFIRQKEYLRDLATKLGLRFRDVDGYVQEIWIGDADSTFGLMSHSDVQPVDATGWIHDPWGGDVIEGKLWGRGAIDDKGPIVAIMYGMRAILDSAVPLQKKIMLLVGTDEESANEDIATYLKTNSPPDQTIVVDFAYPVICAEKGWCGAWLNLPRSETQAKGTGLLIADLHSGLSVSIVPDRAVTKLFPVGIPLEEGRARIESAINSFLKVRPDARIACERKNDILEVTARGVSVHSSVPATGHNALMDLLVFLHRELHPLRNEYALMADFAATNIGFELDGTTLGISHTDDFMGDVTVSVNTFATTDTSAQLMFNFRIPKGVEKEELERALHARYDQFNDTRHASLTAVHYLSSPLYNSPDSPFIQRLTAIYGEITGERLPPRSMGGGTYAKRIPNSVVFGPALPQEEYLGHQPNENINLKTLDRNIEVLTHTMVEMGL